ncbi:MAG: GspH/FimT family pseudopilin, partial [Proteobacteria bacterium]|nr:GspH/FimT family pseudopilin [Pseudomonadota bacterium]
HLTFPRLRRGPLPLPPHAGGEGKQAGFTLIEMLVVLAVIALALTVVPALLGSLPGARLRAAADEVAGALRVARSDALASGRSVEVRFDPAARSYAVVPGGTTRVLPPAVRTMSVTTSAAFQRRNEATFRFFADGTATGGSVVLRDAARATGVTVDWLTGRVRRVD